ncbi:MAG: Gfo/Idh/MocA family oxidoreductase [Saprospiraceae bacterium]|nr:Gfo/Idh/MocA family oxidoreductase [Saprospiraceae bacterium]
MKKNKNNKPNRRSFLKSTGTALVGSTIALNIGFPEQAFAFGGHATTKSNILKVGLIGCGGRGTGAAAQAMAADPDVVLTAMGDAFGDRLEESYKSLMEVDPKKVQVDKAHKFVGFDAYKKVIDSGVDVVILTTPPLFRPDHLIAAIEAGKHVFCEKPVAVDAPGVRKVIAAAKKAADKKLSLVSGFTFRYDFPKRAFFERVLNGEIGDIKTVSSTRNGGYLWYKPRQTEWTDMEYLMRNWYYQNWLSGDYLVEMIVHSLDMMSWAMGDRLPLQATGTGGRQARVDKMYGNIYDHFAIEYEYENSVQGFSFSRQQAGCSNRNSVEIAGTLGNGFVKSSGVLEITGKNKWTYQGEKNDPYQTQHNELFASIRSGHPMNDGIRMANSTMLAIMGRMVAYSGQTLKWDEAINSNQVLGPPSDQMYWDLKFSGPEIAIPGLTKI